MHCRLKIKLVIGFFSAFTAVLAQEHPPINYLNQKPPGLVAELFAPNLVSTGLSEHSAPSFSPDGAVVLWTVMDKNYHGYLLEMKYENAVWSTPARPSFADSTADDYYASFSPDGNKVFFSSRRKLPAGYPKLKDMILWEATKNANGWGKPVPFDTTASEGHEYAHSITKNGTIYFSSPLPGATNMDLRISTKINGHYTKPELLPYSLNSTGYEDGPYIAPDESFLIFESQRPEGVNGSLDLYISFKNKNGGWGMPVNMGPKINSASSERFAGLSPDGKYLFFGSSRNMSADNWGFDIFWISAQIIDELRNTENAGTIIEESLGNKTIAALHKNDLKNATEFLNEWLALYPNSLDAVIVNSSTLRKQKRYKEAEYLLDAKASPWNENISVIMESAIVKMGLNKDDEAAKILAPLLIPGEHLKERYTYLSNALLEMGRFTLSDDYFEKSFNPGAGSFPYYQRAAALAIMGEKDRVFIALNKAAELGGIDKKDYESNPSFECIRSDARWKALMDKLK